MVAMVRPRWRRDPDGAEQEPTEATEQDGTGRTAPREAGVRDDAAGVGQAAFERAHYHYEKIDDPKPCQSDIGVDLLVRVLTKKALKQAPFQAEGNEAWYF